MPWLRFFLFWLLFVLSSLTLAAEKILNFHSDITINQDASLDVTETITVNAEGKEIKRGIYRDFPTAYIDKLGTQYHIQFDLKKIEHNGRFSAYHTQPMPNGIRIYIGEKNSLISNGTHSYKIIYNVTRELGFFEDYDELYWNVTGNGWVFPIEKASATVHLPGSFEKEQLQWNAYNGTQNATNHDYQAKLISPQTVQFDMTKPLRAQEGFTIAVGWPKGYITEPTWYENVLNFIKDNRFIKSALIIAAYYLLCWLLFGRDPKVGLVIPLYESRLGISPSVMRYTNRMKYDNKVFAIALVELAVKGFISINKQEDDRYFKISRVNFDDDLSGESEILIENLFNKGEKSTTNLDGSLFSIKQAIKKHKEYLNTEYRDVNFKTNIHCVWVGIAASFISILWSYASISYQIGIYDLIVNVMKICIAFLPIAFVYTLLVDQASKIFILLIKALFAVACGMFIYIVMDHLPAYLLIGVLFIIVINYLFYKMLPIYTEEGIKIIHEARGFKAFFNVVNVSHKAYGDKIKSADIVDKILPYAMALDMEDMWSNYFAKMLADQPFANEDNLLANNAQQPLRWLKASNISNPKSLSTTCAGLANVISSSVTPPPRTSGSGGRGGFSGSSRLGGGGRSGGGGQSGGGGRSGGGGGGSGGGGW